MDQEHSELEEKLLEEMGSSQWSDLRAHAARDALFLVDPETELIQAALAIASDDTDAVTSLIESRRLVRPTAEQLETWELEPDRAFQTSIVQPFVLAQPLRRAH